MPQTTNSITPNKLTVPDLISVGVFTALYFVLVTVATFTCALLPGVGNIVLPALAALISGSVYMLLAAKLQKFGGITIMGLVMGLFFFVSGHFVLSFAANIVCGLLADLIAARGKFRSEKLLLVSYVVFSYGLTGPILPLWFMKDAYIANLTARGKDAAYIDTLFAPINNGSFVAAMAAILVCAVLGGLSMEDVTFHTMPYQGGMVWSRSLRGMQDYVTPRADELLKLVNQYLNPYNADLTRDSLDVMSIQADGTIASSTGRLADTKHNVLWLEYQAAQNAPPEETEPPAPEETPPEESGGPETPEETALPETPLPGDTSPTVTLPVEPAPTEAPAVQTLPVESRPLPDGIPIA